MRLSILEKVLLLYLNAVLDKELSVLFGKCHSTMMFFLLGDIPHYYIFVAQIVLKASIFPRPSVKKRKMRVLLEPLAGGDFELLDELGHCQSCG